MKKYLLSFVAVLLAIPFGNAATAVLTLSTNKEVGTELKLLAWCTTIDEPVIIDWGDGNEVSYFIDPSAATYNKWTKGTVKGSTITIKGNLMEFEFTEAGITAVTAENQSVLQRLDLAKNEIASFSPGAMPSLTELDLNNNRLTSFDATGMTSLKRLNLKANQIDSHNFNIESTASTLTELNVAENGDNFITLNLINFTALEYFYGMKNPEMTTVVFADGNTNLRQIDMSECYIMHFYAITLPSLTTLNLGNNALLEFEQGTYPKLSTLSLNDNYLSEVDVTSFRNLTSLSVANNSLLYFLDVSNAADLSSLNISGCNFSSINLKNNASLKYLYVQNNPNLAHLDVTPMRDLRTLKISNTKIANIDLSNAYFLQEFYAENTQCPFFYFNYLNPSGNLRMVDIRNNKNMTGASVTFSLRTLPACSRSTSTANLLLEGSNAETADTSYATSSDMQWKVDVTGDGTASNAAVPVTVDATPTGNTITKTGYFGGNLSVEKTVVLTEYAASGGTFTLEQWSGPYYQDLSDVTTSALNGVAVHINAVPDEGYTFKGVMVNGNMINEEWFLVSENAVIKPVFGGEERKISFTCPLDQPLSFALAALSGSDKVYVDWGNGARQEYSVTSTSWTRIDGTAVGDGEEATVSIYGDVFAAHFESFGEYGELIGAWNNKISSFDFSQNEILTMLNLYMNPIHTLNVGHLKDLYSLDCGYCELTSLDVSHNDNLEELSCKGNYLTSLDLKDCHFLHYLDAGVNLLESLDLGATPHLNTLLLANNNLETIDVSMLQDVSKMSLQGNLLTSIDLSNNSWLKELNVSGNNLSSLDVSANHLLGSLSFSNNAIHAIDLSNNSEIYRLDCGGNGMDACQLNDFYLSLPSPADAPEDMVGVSLTVLTGTEDTPNDAENADSRIATDKGWTVNISGNGSGCDVAPLFINPTVNGSVQLLDADGNAIESGSKVKKNSPITIVPTPDEGYVFDKATANNVDIDGLQFKVYRLTNFAAFFKQGDAVTAITLDGVNIFAAGGAVKVATPDDAKVEIFDINATKLIDTAIHTSASFPMTAGLYLVRVTTVEGSMARIVAVK